MYKSVVVRARSWQYADNANGCRMPVITPGGGLSVNTPPLLDCDRNARVAVEIRICTDGPAGDYTFVVHHAWMANGDRDLASRRVTNTVTAHLAQTNVMTRVNIFDGYTPDTDVPTALLISAGRTDGLSCNLWSAGCVMWYPSSAWGATAY